MRRAARVPARIVNALRRVKLTGTIVDLDHGRTRSGAELAGLAHALVAREGIRAGQRIGMIAHASSDVFVAQLACMIAGATFVPLSWRATERELDAILASCGARVITVGELAAPAAEPIAIDPEAIVQRLFTSGTTGAPRGIAIRGRQLIENARATITTCALTDRDRVYACLPMFHTGGLNCLATPALAAGATVYVARFDARSAVTAISDHAITSIVAVPAMYERMLDAGLRAGSLRNALVGGAPVGETLRTRAKHAGLALRQGYGSTEAGPNLFDFGDDTVGWPVPNLEVRIELGELWLRGPQVSESGIDEDGWLHTGDLVECTARGYRIVGRAKDMYISGGENVYPAEVELAIAEHPDIAEVAVVGVADPKWGEVGAAMIVPRTAISTDALATWLRTRIAGYKVPRTWRVLDELPRTSTGKVARGVLRELVSQHG